MLNIATLGVGTLEWQDSLPVDELTAIWEELKAMHKQSSTPNQFDPTR